MPRESRKRSNSGVYHIMLRGINRQHIFEDDEDYSRFLETLAKYREECGYSLYGYCLMPNHVHLVLREGKQPFYDVWVTGNHEYDYGLDAVKKIIRDLRCRVLTGNVYDADGNPIADGYAILSVNGIRVAVISMVTPNIARWSAPNLAGCAVTDPLEETRRIIDSIRDRYDVLVDLINAVQSHYADTVVSATALPGADANLYPGEIRKCDMARLYRFSNTLYKLRMTGAQLSMCGISFADAQRLSLSMNSSVIVESAAKASTNRASLSQ